MVVLTIAADGKPEGVMTAQMLRQVFGVESDVILDPRRGTPLCLPYAAYSGGILDNRQ